MQGYLGTTRIALGIDPTGAPGVTVVCDCPLRGERPQVTDGSGRDVPSPLRGDGRTGLVRGLGSAPAHQVPGAGTGIVAQLSLFCSQLGRGQTLTTPSPAPRWRVAGTCCLHISLPATTGHWELAPLRLSPHPRHRLRLSVWLQSLHAAGKQAVTHWDCVEAEPGSVPALAQLAGPWCRITNRPPGLRHKRESNTKANTDPFSL